MSSALETNPFYVLELRPGVSPPEIERAGQRLLAMLGVGLVSAQTYLTPFGPRPRDAEQVRLALDELRDPERRARHAVWAALPASEVPPIEVPNDPWPEALDALGRRRGETARRVR